MPVPARLLHAALWLIGSLPISVLQRMGAALGGVVRGLGLREARVARRSLELCFPDMDEAARQRLWCANLAETARTLLETARFWTRPATRNLALVREVHGGELFDTAIAAGRGVIIAAPHLGNWELLNQWLASRSALAILYRPPRQPWGDTLIRRLRAQPGVTQVRAEASGVRTLFRILKEGGMVGILPDQQPKRGDGEFAPFFGIPALTMTLLPRLANKTGATVLMAFAERLPGAAGFRIRILPAPVAVSDQDPMIATAALNAAVERCIALAPAQYQWSYKRFTIRPENAEPIRYD
ncbi:lipid A biosynthesis lauroyl acyltransferase [Xanthomonadaceae bacterium JHOS43]|nr:lipid A biosynthesis lauroyl acyltransferase [Xanthomonadaceae bacterium JHOS43]